MTDTLASLEARLQALQADGAITRELIDAIHALSDELLPRSPDRMLAMNEGALRAADRLGHAVGRYMSLVWIGFYHYWTANYEVALQMTHKALGLYSSVQGTRRWEGWNLLGLGNTYLALNDYERAITMNQRCLAFFEAAAFPMGQARALAHIATVYQALAQYEKALSYYERSLAIFRDIRDSLGESRVLDDMGRLQEALGDYDAALALYRRSFQLRETLGNRQAECTSLISLGRIYNLKGMPDEALPMLRRALEQAKAIESKPKMHEAHHELANAHEAAGDLREALHHLRAFHGIKEVVAGEETRARINHLQISFEVAQAEKEAEIERLRNVELRATNDRLASLLAELKATQRQLIQQEKMASLGQLTAGIAHEIKNPLNFVNNFAGLNLDLLEEIVTRRAASPGLRVDEASDLLDDVRENSRRIHHHGRRADRMVDSQLSMICLLRTCPLTINQLTIDLSCLPSAGRGRGLSASRRAGVRLRRLPSTA